MDIVTVAALVLAVASLVVGVLAWRRAGDASAAADKLEQRMVELANATPRSNAGADPTRVAAPASTSSLPRSLPEGVVIEQQAFANDTGATLVVRSGSSAGQDLPTNQGTGSGLIGIFLFNQGPATAHDLQLTATFPSGVIRRSTANHTLSARKEGTLFVQIVPQDFGPDDGVDVTYCIRYRDVNGDHELLQPVRVQGGWKGPWATYLQSDPAQPNSPGVSAAKVEARAT